MYKRQGPKEPSITLLDPLHHVPLSSHGMVSPNAGDRVYDPSQDVPISGVTRVIALGGPDLPVHFRSEVYEYTIMNDASGGVIRADSWVWRETPTQTHLYRVYIKGTGESRIVMGDEIMMDRYIGDPRRGPSQTTYDIQGEFMYSADRTPSTHWEELTLRPGDRVARRERREIVGAAFLAMVATIGVEPVHTRALDKALKNVLDSCGR